MRRALHLTIICIIALTTGCGAPPTTSVPTAAGPQGGQITEAEARQRAIAAAAQGGPELEPAQDTPLVRSIERTTWRAAGAAHDLPTITALDPATAVWVVALTSAWQGGMQAPGVTATPAQYRTALVILNAANGEVITVSHRP